MTKPFNDPLLLIGKIFCIFLQAVMAIGLAGLLIAFVAILFAQDVIRAEIATEFPGAVEEFPAYAIAAIMAIGLAMLTMLFVFFGKLRQIISTVGEGDPFQPANATRLSIMAWLMLGTQLLIIPAMAIAMQMMRFADEIKKASAENIQISDGAWGFDPTGLLFVIILFILARVFRHGAAMRDDLEGTV